MVIIRNYFHSHIAQPDLLSLQYKETVIEDSQPPVDDFDFLVTQLSQLERTAQTITNADSANPPLKPGRQT